MNTLNPFFSIIIPSLNEEKYLPNLLEDLASQTFRDFEVILVDGKSEDRTIKMAEKFKVRLKNFSIITTEKRNVSHQRNQGAKRAKSLWLLFMDADNRIPTYFLQGLKYRVENLNPDILSTWIEAETKDRKDQAVATFVNVFLDFQKTSSTPYLLEAMVCTKKDVFEKLKGFNESLPWGEGNDLLRKARKKNIKFYFVKDPKYKYCFRRLRKEGTFKALRYSAQIELARIMKINLPKKKFKYLYPMEGGGYFEITEKPDSKIVNRMLKLLKYAPIKNPKINHLGKIFLRKLFFGRKKGFYTRKSSLS